MKMFRNLAIAGCALLATASAASAAIVCNDDGDCWHTSRRYAYKPDFRVTVHPDNWKWKEGDHYRWREHAGRGYWRSGVWIGF